MYKSKFKVGQIVALTSEALQNYGIQYANTPFKIIYKSTNINQHPGYDKSLKGMGLYDLKHKRTGKPFPYSLYDWELEKY